VEVGRFDAEQAGGLAQVAPGPVDSLMDHPFFSRFGRLSGDPIDVEVGSAREWSQGANLFGQVRPFTGLDEGFPVERRAQVFRSRSARNCVSLSPHSVCLMQKRCATLIVAHRPCVKQMPLSLIKSLSIQYLVMALRQDQRLVGNHSQEYQGNPDRARCRKCTVFDRGVGSEG